MTRKTLLLAALPLAASAFDDNGSYFEHKNWEIACDNTGTCRAAGYQAGEEDQAISILLMRDAGADAAITGEITVIDPNGDDKNRQALSGHLYLDDKNLGNITLSDDEAGLKGRLSPTQSEAVSKAVVGSGKITFRTDKLTWALSNEGASAVLLKMDEYQGRVGTPTALVKRGSDKKTIPAPAAKPVIHAAALPGTPPRVLKAGDGEYSALRRLLAVTPAQVQAAARLLLAAPAAEITVLPQQNAAPPQNGRLKNARPAQTAARAVRNKAEKP